MLRYVDVSPRFPFAIVKDMIYDSDSDRHDSDKHFIYELPDESPHE